MNKSLQMIFLFQMQHLCLKLTGFSRMEIEDLHLYVLRNVAN